MEFTYNNIKFVIQAYKKNEFANICVVNEYNGSFDIEFKTKSITTQQKESIFWKILKEKILIEFDIIKNLIDETYENN